jgi:hypothetical protein
MPATRRQVREMSISQQDFFRLLPAAMGMPFSRAGLRVVARRKGRRVAITLSGQRTVQLGALRLPSIAVTLEASGFDVEAWGDFLRAFDSTYQRGGG